MEDQHCKACGRGDVDPIVAWIKEQADKGEIQISRSLLGKGYEIALVPKGKASTVEVFTGDFFECIEQVMIKNRK